MISGFLFAVNEIFALLRYYVA